MRLGLALLLLIVAAAPAWGAVTRIQGCNARSDGSTTTVACTMGSAVAAGNLLVIGTSTANATSTLSSLAATGDTCVIDTPKTSQAPPGAIYVGSCPNTAANTPTITATWSAVGFHDIVVEEYSGAATVSPFDVSAGAAGTGTTFSATTPTTNQANELVFGVAVGDSAESPTQGSSCVKRQETPTDALSSEDKNVTSVGAQTCSFTVTVSTDWIMITATYKEAAQPPRSMHQFRLRR